MDVVGALRAPTADLVALLRLRAGYVRRTADRGGALRVVARSGVGEAELQPTA